MAELRGGAVQRRDDMVIKDPHRSPMPQAEDDCSRQNIEEHAAHLFFTSSLLGSTGRSQLPANKGGSE